MILIDTSVIVAWLDTRHEHHKPCEAALTRWAAEDELAVSCVTYAELAAGARTKEGVDEALAICKRVDLDFEAAWVAGQRFRRFQSAKRAHLVLPDFFIRAQAAVLNCRHLTNDRGRLALWPDVDFLFP
jgi:predicted nucleic acid-binding protein